MQIPRLFVEVPKERKLLNNLNRQTKEIIEIPKGSHFDLHLIIKKDSDFLGELNILEKNKEIYSLIVERKSMKKILKSSSINLKLYDVYKLNINILEETKKYTFLLSFDAKPKDASIQLFWLSHYF